VAGDLGQQRGVEPQGEPSVDVDLAHVVDDERHPARFARTWFKRVVLPDPRKPESTVRGSFAMVFGIMISGR
jgi:hypothetical protein